MAGEETEKAHHLSDLTLPGKLFVFDDMDEMRRHAHMVPEGTLQRIRYVMQSMFRALPLEIVHRIGSLFTDAAISTFSKIPLVRKAQFMVLYHHLLIGGL